MAQMFMQKKAKSVDAKATGTGGKVLQDNRANAARTAVLQDNRPVQRKNHTGMPDKLKAGVEALSGMSMDHVRVHYNSDKPRALQAHAYAQGNQIHLAPGQEKHLPHEAWHVVQQAQGRVRPTVQMKQGVAVNDDKELENEADVMGGRAMHKPMIQVGNPDPEIEKIHSPAGTMQMRSKVVYESPDDYDYDWPFAPLNPQPRLAQDAEMGVNVSAELDRTDPIHGSAPTRAYAQQRARADTEYKHGGRWVLGHLVNHELGGLGTPTNLFPITHEANMEHYHAVERKVKNLLYRQDPAGNFELANHGYLEYQVEARPVTTGDSQEPAVDFHCSWRTQQHQNVAPVNAPIWNPRNVHVVESRTDDNVNVPIAWWAMGQNRRRNAALFPVQTIAQAALANAFAAVAGGVVPRWHPGAISALVQNAGLVNAKVIGWEL